MTVLDAEPCRLCGAPVKFRMSPKPLDHGQLEQTFWVARVCPDRRCTSNRPAEARSDQPV